jgi:hypothetical protein
MPHSKVDDFYTSRKVDLALILQFGSIEITSNSTDHILTMMLPNDKYGARTQVQELMHTMRATKVSPFPQHGRTDSTVDKILYED